MCSISLVGCLIDTQQSEIIDLAFCPENSSIFDVKHGDTWQLEIKNNSETTLYFTTFDFQKSWKIYNLFSDGGHGGFWVLEPKSTELLRLEMQVPEFEFMQTDVQGSCEDVFKLFVTSKATPFPSMVLPELPLWGSSHREQPYEAGDGLSALVAGLTGYTRGNDAEYENWATRTIIVRTTKN
ncbi:hypothetical protein HDV63DRAFT_411148 [Trichoderma sp. SZMC 28014]